MKPQLHKNWMLHIVRAGSITRRYMVTNGFDGALTMLGMLTGFHTSNMSDIPVALSACLGAAIALFVSGLSSAYLSEKAEREKELHELEQALITDLSESDYGQASRYLPILVALVNGLSPLLLSLIILLPLFVANQGHAMPWSPFATAIALGLLCVFTLGVFLGKISNAFWLWSGLKALFIATVTVAVILLFDY